jgi:hypothetical protein
MADSKAKDAYDPLADDIEVGAHEARDIDMSSMSHYISLDYAREREAALRGLLDGKQLVIQQLERRYERLKSLIEISVNACGEQTFYASWNFGPASMLPSTFEEILDEGINVRR